MKKSIYVITGVIALTLSGVAIAQQMGHGRGMSEMDTDGNGTVEKSEFTAMFEKRFADTDKNGDGISMDEYKAKSDADRAERHAKRAERKAEKAEKRAEKSTERDAKRAERTKERFERLDANSDGKVTADEYKAAGEKMFDRMDRNSDGILNDRRDRDGHGKRGHKGHGSRS